MASSTPEDIQATEQIFDIDFHPKVSCVATGMIDGSILLHKYGNNNGDNTIFMSAKLHNIIAVRLNI